MFLTWLKIAQPTDNTEMKNRATTETRPQLTIFCHFQRFAIAVNCNYDVMLSRIGLRMTRLGDTRFILYVTSRHVVNMLDELLSIQAHPACRRQRHAEMSVDGVEVAAGGQET